jgi:multisubunit Na+/H+ antiporter MnhE subunit
MEIFRESVPFLVGLVLSPVLWLMFRAAVSRAVKSSAFLGGALVTGAAVSLLNGEIIGQNIGAAIGSIALDSLIAGAVAAAVALVVLKRILPARQTAELLPAPVKAE